MATQLKKTVKPSGGDYTSLEACMAANQQDLVAADKYFDVEIDGTWSSADTTICSVDTYTTDATRYINIYTTAAARHLGLFSTSYYVLEAGSGFSNSSMNISGSYVTVTGIQIYESYVGAGQPTAISCGASTNIIVASCIIRGGSQVVQFYGGSGTSTYRNCVLYGSSGNGVLADAYGSTQVMTFENCTFVACAATGMIRVGNRGSIVAKNVYCGGNVTADYNNLTSMTTCASSDTTGTAGLQSIAYSTANLTNVTAGSENMHLVTGSALIDVGTDLSASFTVDIDGATRSGTWDIGADEFVAAAGAPLSGKRRMGLVN